MSTEPTSSVFGRDAVIVKNVAKSVHRFLAVSSEHTDMREERRGNSFDLRPAAHPHHTIRVTVELVRVEPSTADGRPT